MSKSALEVQRDEELANDKTLADIRFRQTEEDREANRQKFLDEHVAAPGAIPNIPPLLEARRLKYGIPDMFFLSQACNNKVNIFQISTEGEDQNYGDGPIIMPDWKREQTLQEAPQGILVGGGLEAMDHMHSNGYWLGHKINFIKMSPYMKCVGRINGKEQYVLCMTCGDITDSEDLAHYMRAGKVKVGRRDYAIDDGTTGSEHYLEDCNEPGKVWDPSKAVMLDEERDS